MADEQTLLARQRAEGVAGHSACDESHDHGRDNDCCGACATWWAAYVPTAIDTCTTPFEPWHLHQQGNLDLDGWAMTDRVGAEMDAYNASWTPETCQHEMCFIPDEPAPDGHYREICARCDQDVSGLE